MIAPIGPPQISPVVGAVRPTWSVMIPTYECANYLEHTLRSVLAQDPGPEIMQIEVVDDHSVGDDPSAVVGDLGGDRVSFFRQSRNVWCAARFPDSGWMVAYAATFSGW